MPTRRDRVAGGLLGVHAGDALGATVEFSSWEAVRSRYPDGVTEIVGGGPFGWPAGHATDDTDLTRAVLLAYLLPGEDVVRTAADRMLAWLDGEWPDRETGTAPGAGTGRAGNGSLMRCLPTALAVGERDRRLRESMEISAVT